MADGVDETAAIFGAEIQPATRPRDVAGKFVQTVARPEPLLAPRELENPEADGGDNPALRQRERQIEREPDEPAELDDDERQALSETREPHDLADPDDDDAKYEVTVDGATRHVTLKEALEGYVRQETFHQRMQELTGFRNALDEDAKKQQANWALLQKGRVDYEADVYSMLPPEPDWDRLFAVDPNFAHQQQKMFQGVYAKLAESRQQRAELAQQAKAESDRRLEKYAVDGFSKFVMDAKIPDKDALDKELKSMRKTALAVGFTEQEVATVYDPRMLTILRKASKYDRMMAAAKPKAVVPGQRTLAPGASTPLSGNGRRSGLDDAQRRLASTGRLDDAEDVFRRML